MTNKTILILTITAAFVAGTMTSGTMANAASNGQGQPFDFLAQQIDDLADELRGVDADLQSNIDAETAARVAADSNLQSTINSETAARVAADSNLQSTINSETAARVAADSNLQSTINSETAARLASDSFLQSEIEVLEFRITALENP